MDAHDLNLTDNFAVGSHDHCNMPCNCNEINPEKSNVESKSFIECCKRTNLLSNGQDEDISTTKAMPGGTGGERYNNVEKIRIVQLFAETSNNACDVQRRFKNEFMKKPPSTKTIRTLFKKFKETGSITRKPYSQRVRPKSNDENVARVKDFFRKNPELSTRKAAKSLNLSRSTVAKIVRDLKGREGGQIKRNRIMKKRGTGAKNSGRCFTPGTSNTTVLPTKAKQKIGDTNMRSILSSVMFCIEFAAQKHRNQRRNDPEATPFINYPIGVANILVQEGGIEDTEIIEAAILQKTLEDSLTTIDVITSNFSPKVASIADELATENRYPKEQRRKLEVENASEKSYAAQLIGMADKIYELRDCAKCLPEGWNEQMRYDYYMWVKQIVQPYYAANYTMASILQTFFTERNV